MRLGFRGAAVGVVGCVSVVLGAAGCTSGTLKQAVSTAKAPAAIGPYSQAIQAGNLMFLSGQIAIDPQTNELNAGSIEEQTKQALENLSAVLEANGMSMRNVVNTTVYLTDVSEFSRMNAVYATFFTQTPPARATVQVARLPRDARVEIAAIAMR